MPILSQRPYLISSRIAHSNTDRRHLIRPALPSTPTLGRLRLIRESRVRHRFTRPFSSLRSPIRISHIHTHSSTISSSSSGTSPSLASCRDRQRCRSILVIMHRALRTRHSVRRRAQLEPLFRCRSRSRHRPGSRYRTFYRPTTTLRCRRPLHPLRPLHSLRLHHRQTPRRSFSIRRCTRRCHRRSGRR